MASLVEKLGTTLALVTVTLAFYQGTQFRKFTLRKLIKTVFAKNFR